MSKHYIFDLASHNSITQLISGLSTDKKWTIEIKRTVKKRTLNQNGLMWKWLDNVAKVVSEDTGSSIRATKDDIHEHMKQEFLTPELIEIGDAIFERRSTKNLSVKEMSDYMEKVYVWATRDMGYLLPLPLEHGRD